MYEEDIKTFWDHVHVTERCDGKGLTGSHLKDYLEFFKIQDKYDKAVTILDIGVGLGYVAKEAADQGKVVSGVDISHVGLSAISDYLENAWLPTEYSKIPSRYFDIVFSKTVSLHLTDEELEDQIKNVIRILSVDGVFALEFYDRPSYTGGICQRAGTMYRTFDFVKELVAKHAGTISFHTCHLYTNIQPNILGWGLWIVRKE
jgi:2-polyprenyl-3-methyl-5-hydroxy-6-metoxy-1,4-benzoquinol methylase